MLRAYQENVILTDWEGTERYLTQRTVSFDANYYYGLHQDLLADLLGEDEDIKNALNGKIQVSGDLASILRDLIQGQPSELAVPVGTVLSGEQIYSEPVLMPGLRANSAI